MLSIDNQQNTDTSLRRFQPEPKFKGSINLKNAITSLGNVANSFIRTAIGGDTGVIGGIDSGYAEIISRQIELQEQMMLVSMQSNLERTKHDTRMAPIRNLRIA